MLCFNASIRSTTFCSARSWLVSGARNSSGAAESFPLKETLEGPKRYHPPIRSGTNMAGHQDARYIPPRRERDRSPRLSRMGLALAAVILVAVALAAFMLLRVVCWNAIDVGVIGTTWSGVTICRNDGHTGFDRAKLQV